MKIRFTGNTKNNGTGKKGKTDRDDCRVSFNMTPIIAPWGGGANGDRTQGNVIECENAVKKDRPRNEEILESDCKQKDLSVPGRAH